jgi:hypothetical protein
MTPRWPRPHGFDGGVKFIAADHNTVVPLEGCDDGGARARAAGWKISTLTIRPPQQGHGGQGCGSGAVFWCWRSEQFPGTREICLAASAGKNAIVTDAVEALRQNVEQEAADELIRAELGFPQFRRRGRESGTLDLAARLQL